MVVHPDDPTSGGTGGERDELYDAYLDAVLGGRAEPPEAFLARHGVRDDSLAEALEAIYTEASNGSGPAVARPGDLAPGTSIGEFRLIRKLGEGGMGVVWLAHQKSLDREVALKLIRTEYATSPIAAKRFEREARAIAGLRHPNIVNVFAVGEEGGKQYLAMEFVEGRGLDEILAGAAREPGSLPLRRTVRWCADLARALDAAHEHGVIHRDVKPSNIHIARDGRPLLLDFGLAREIDQRAATLTQSFVGSPFYAAPEQIGRGGGLLDGRTDIYSLGVVLYQCLTRSVPFASGTLEQVLQSILTDDPPPAASVNPAVSRDLSIVVAKAMAKDPARRYQTAGAFAADLEAVLERRPIAARPPGRVERIAMWARRRPAWATAAVAAIGTLALLAGVLAFQRIEAAHADRRALAAALTESDQLLAAYEESRETSREMEELFEHRARSRYTLYWTAEEDRELDEIERRTRELRREREQMFYRVLDLVREAERLGVSPTDAEGVLARLYAQRFLDAQIRRNPVEVTAYRELALRHDPGGAVLEDLRDGTTLTITTPTPGAEVFIFRREPAWVLDNDAEPRLVLAPINGPAPAPLDHWALRVVRGGGELVPGDLILDLNGHPIRGSLLIDRDNGALRRFDRLVSIDGEPVSQPWHLWPADETTGVRAYRFESAGTEIEIPAPDLESIGVRAVAAWRLPDLAGAQATVWTGGAQRRLTLPSGLAVRPTAAPAFLGEASFVGRTPVDRFPVYTGDHVVVIRQDGRELRRMASHLPRQMNNQMLDIELLPEGTTPEGFVFIGRGRGTWKNVEPFWIMEREVTLGEYLEFVNDPETLAAIDASESWTLYPRLTEALARRGADGLFRPAPGWSPDRPVVGIDRHDADAYANWRTRRARESGREVEFDLPSLEEWVLTCGSPTDAPFVFGDVFRPKWVSSVRAKPTVAFDAPLSFPIDESVLGVFDMAGCVSEWTRSPWGEDGVSYRHAGGSYAHGEPGMFKVYGGNGLQPEQRSGAIGFRLVMRRRGGAE